MIKNLIIKKQLETCNLELVNELTNQHNNVWHKT